MSRKKKDELNEEKSGKGKKIAIIIVAIIVVIAIIAGSLFFVLRKDGGDNSNNVVTQSVKIFTDSMNLFQNRYSGMVVAQDTVKIKKDSTQKVKELYVEKGQAVEKGQKLFEYDTTENSNKVEQTKLEIEKMQNSISNNQKQIQSLAEERNAHPDNSQALTIQIQELENEVKQTEYNIKTKELEITALNKAIKNAVVKAEINGIIQNINDGDNDTSSGYQQEPDDSYITIMQTGDYKIKGVVNEQNVMMFTEGQKVIIRSRLDESKTWSGTITKVDTANPESNDNSGMMMYGNSDEMTTSSKYPFYITLEQKDGLMMGQHVYIEFDYGQIAKQDGIWIPSYFVVEEDGNSYVWVAGKGDKLEKRKVTVGTKDENLLEYQITEGLSKEDYIAEPREDLVEGSKVDKYDDVADIPMDMPDDMNMEGDMSFDMNGEGGAIIEDGAMLPEGAIPEGEVPSGNAPNTETVPQDSAKAGEQTEPAETPTTAEGAKPAETKDATKEVTKDAGGKK